MKLWIVGRRLNPRHVRFTGLVAVTLLFLLFTRSSNHRAQPSRFTPKDTATETCENWVKTLDLVTPLIIDLESTTPDLNLISTVRRYNHCVFKQGLRCDPQLERKIHDWYSGSAPLLSDKYVKDMPTFTVNPNECFFTQMKSNLKGKGLVLTATDGYFKQILSLIVLLRTLGSSLPFQIIHKGEITEFSQQRLILAATSDWTTNQDIMKLTKHPKFHPSFPKIDLSFVDVSTAIKPHYLKKFIRFNNKLLAYLFNTFEEMMLIDTDTAFLYNPEEFFKFEEFVQHGTFFFKDRALANNHYHELSMDTYHSLLPTKEDLAFGIGPLTEYTFNQRFFKGFLHLQESGVVMVNRKRHFESSVLTLTLSLHQGSVMSLMWGDKELYWLSFVFQGDESFYFNPNHAAAIGELTPDAQHSHYPHLEINELCSSHPAHLAKDKKTLLWINSGFRYCKKVMYHDEENPFFKDWEMSKIAEYNTGSIKFKHVLLPPEPKRPGLGPVDESPSRGWVPRPYCEAYTLCAYDQITGSDEKGVIVEIPEEQEEYFDYIATTWLNSIKILSAAAN